MVVEGVTTILDNRSYLKK